MEQPTNNQGATAASPVEAYLEELRAAVDSYLELGWSVIPLRLSDKQPAITWTQYQERQPTEDEVEDWFANGVPAEGGGRARAFGIGIVTGALSKLVVLDCDNDEALAYALGEGGIWSPLRVKTTRGYHLYLAHPGNTRVSNKAGGIGTDWPDVKGLDLRGDGGFVVAPPTYKFSADGAVAHRYSWQLLSDQSLTDAVMDLPVWSGMRNTTTPSPVVNGEFSLEALRLDGVKASYGAGVWDEARALTEKRGRKMAEGEGRNAWMARYLGECVASGMDEEQARVAGQQFTQEFFDQPLPQAEFDRTLASIIAIDKRNHPEKYEPAPGYVNKTPERIERAKAIRLITPSTLAELRKRSSGQQFLIDPFVPTNSIIQVVGFNGHGKSLWTLNMIWAACSGVSIGSGVVERPLRALYLDHESSTQTLKDRADGCEAAIGPMPSNLSIYSKALGEMPLNYREADSIAYLDSLLKEVRPDVVVIDTVREAWLGMEENSPQSWMHVNQLAIAIRNAGSSVLLIHHRNKPNQQGLGREAGSTAQLKDLDLQLIVTQVAEGPEAAARNAAIEDMRTQVIDAAGNQHTAHGYLRASLPPGFKLSGVFELSFGKLRQRTENHVTTYVGLATNLTTGKSRWVSTLTPRQKAVRLVQQGKTLAEVADFLQVPAPVVTRWVTPPNPATTNH